MTSGARQPADSRLVIHHNLSQLGRAGRSGTGTKTSDQVGAEILSLQTRMQASMQTTATLFQMSLVNYM